MTSFHKIDRINRIFIIIGAILVAWGGYMIIAGNRGQLNFNGLGEIGFIFGFAPVLVYLAVMILYPLAYLYGKVPTTEEPKTIRPLLYVTLAQLILLVTLLKIVPHSVN